MTAYVARRQQPYQEPATGAWVWERRDDEKDIYELDLTGLLSGVDTASTVEKKSSNGVTVDSQTLSGNTLQVVVSDGTGYAIFKVTTTAGYIHEVIFKWRPPQGVAGDAYA